MSGVASVIENASGHDDALSERLAGVLTGEIGIGRPDRIVAEHRARDFGQRVRKKDQWLPWRAQNRPSVCRIQRSWLAARIVPPVWSDLQHLDVLWLHRQSDIIFCQALRSCAGTRNVVEFAELSSLVKRIVRLEAMKH